MKLYFGFVFSTAFRRVGLIPILSAKLISAFISFGRHEPPYPGPAFRNNAPILGSNPIVFAISSMLAPGIFWHMLDS